MSERTHRVTHKVKTWPVFFEPTMKGIKKFDLRKNDRGYQVGDEILHQEWEPPKYFSEMGGDGPGQTIPGFYTGREVLVRVDYILTFKDASGFGLMPLAPDYVIMSTSLLP